MKISTIVLSLVTIAGMAEAKSSLRPENRRLQEAVETLKSPECEPYVKEFANTMQELLDNSPASVTAYVCNPIERKKIVEAEKAAVKDVETGASEGSGSPCLVAYETIMAEQKSTVIDTMKSTKDCKEEVTQEIQAMTEVMEGGGGRRQLFIGALLGMAAPILSTVVEKVIPKGKRRRQRKLAVALNDEDVAHVFNACKNQEYQLSMYMEAREGNPHINMVASALDATKAGCKAAMAFDDYSLGHRLISFVDDLGFEDDWEKKSLPLGTFTLSQVKAASDAASVVMPFHWDAMTNNCATHVIDMMHFLKIPISDNVIQYVVDSLVTNADYVNAVGGSAEAMFGPDGEPLTEHKEKMYNFVSGYVEAHN